MRKYYLFIVVLIVFCIGVVGYQIVTSRGPATDSKTAQDLSTISNQVEEYATTNNRLPTAISSITKLSDDVVKRAQKYTYTNISMSKYRLCATFLTDTSKSTPSYLSSYSAQEANTRTDSYVYHRKGYQCFTNEVYSLTNFSESTNVTTQPDTALSVPSSDGAQFATLCSTKIAGTLISSQVVTSSNSSQSDPNSGAMYAGEVGKTQHYYIWQYEKPVGFDAKCSKIDVSELKPNDKIDIIYELSNSVFTIKAFQKH